MPNQRIKVTITGFYDVDLSDYELDSVEDAVKLDQEVLNDDGPFEAIRWMEDDITIKVEAV